MFLQRNLEPDFFERKFGEPQNIGVGNAAVDAIETRIMFCEARIAW